MIDLGRELREAREAKGVSLAEAETAIRIRERYLKALELNDWAALPTQVQARGFLRNYAVYLGIDEDQALSWFSQITRSAEVSLPPAAAVGSAVPTTNEDGAVFRPRDIDIEGSSTVPTWISSDIVIGVVLALVVALIGFGLIRFAFGDSNDDSGVLSTTPGLTPVTTQGATLATTTAETRTSPGEPTPAAIVPTFDASAGNVQLSLVATEHVWVRVTVDGAQVLEGVLTPAAPQEWVGNQQVVLETANGAGLSATVNGQPQGTLGERGQAVTLAWGPNGRLLLTPTPNP